MRIALAGNPNCGKTTLFNLLTGSNQFVGNWPGVTVEKKEGRLKGHEDVIVTDLPGIYSLSPYTPEEVVAREYLINERPDAVLNMVDGTILERSLYLTTQMTEMGIPVVIAVNMMDVVEKNGDTIDIEALSKKLGCKVVTISALQGTGIEEAMEAAVYAAKQTKTVPMHAFSGPVEHALAHIEEAAVHHMPLEQQRWYAIKIFERDKKIWEQIPLSDEMKAHMEQDIQAAERELSDDAESIIINQRYAYIDSVIKACYRPKNEGALTISDKIDKIVTNRWLALPIFAVVMFLVYYISVSTVGTIASGWANDGLFGDGFHLLGNGTAEYSTAVTEYAKEAVWTEDVLQVLEKAAAAGVTGAEDLKEAAAAEDFGTFEELYGYFSHGMAAEGYSITEQYEGAMSAPTAPSPENYGIWVPGIPVLAERGLAAANTPEWLNGLILDGIIGGVGAVLGFVPQMLVLFFMLAFLEACGYMSRIAFVMDKIFRKFGLSGKSFIPILIGTGCSVPGIMASRTIENVRDRRMTVITTSFMPCGAKLPMIALISAALFGRAGWVAFSAYAVGVAAIVLSGIMLRKTSMFAGESTPFVMELPAYHMPTLGNVVRSAWERGWSFIKKAGTVILLSSILIWAGSVFGVQEGIFGFHPDLGLENSILGVIGGSVAWIFTPVGFGNAKAVIATLMGLVAKEEVVSVFGVLGFSGMTPLSAYAFLMFNLLCAPCFAAVGAIRREMNSPKWTFFAIGYQTILAYATALVIYQTGLALGGKMDVPWFTAAMAIVAVVIYMLVRKPRNAEKSSGRKPAAASAKG